jgi:hypothetical protein
LEEPGCTDENFALNGWTKGEHGAHTLVMGEKLRDGRISL